MKIKTYVVGSLSEAVERIKQDLGPDAVILSTRRAPVSSKWWQRNLTRLEVTAAIDPVGKPGPEPDRAVPQPGQLMRMLEQMTEEQLAPLRSEMAQMRKLMLQMGEGTAPAVAAEEAGGSGAARTPQGAVASEVDSAVFDICQALLWHRLNPRVVEQLADALLAAPAPTGTGDLRGQTAEWLMRQLPDVVPLHADPRQDRVIALVGPTGAGKTTTLVKLASRLTLEQKRTMAFITIDHFRVGAEAQLKKYADILQAPCALAVNREELEQAINRFADVDLIFIDTTGRSPSDREGVEALKNILDIRRPIWRGLVLPATLQEPELTNAIAKFRLVGFDRLILTKLDEAVAFGTLFNAPHTAQCGLSYFTTGQQVPEDCEVASKERIMDCLLNFSGQYTLPEPSVQTHPRHDLAVRREELQ